MGGVIHLRGDPHEETQRLLPWYVTGRLETADRLIVDAHLVMCAECREELVLERRLGAAVRDLPSAADEPWERFAGGLPPQHGDRRWWQQPVRVAWFVAAQAAVVVMCIGIVATRRETSPAPAYRALGDAPAARVGNMVVIFASGTPDEAMKGAIGAAHARLIDGPTATGAYVLAVAPAERGAALAKLRAHAGVTLAEPIDAPPS